MRTFLGPLSPGEEKEYIHRMMEGDREARETLIEHNMRLVTHIIKKYSLPDKDKDDLISIGTIGLIKAINTFNPEKGNRLASYAARCIENELLMMLRNDKKHQRETSIFEPIGTDKEGNAINLMDVIQSDDKDVVEAYAMSLKVEWLREAVVNVLDEREQKIIGLRYGMGNRKIYTQKEVAKEMGISRSYVSRIEKHALEKMLAEFENDKNHKDL